MRLIDADVLEENLKGSCKDNENLGWAFVEFMRYVDDTPTLKVNHTNTVLDKIRAEIAQYKRITYSTDPYNLVGYCLDIIDKYRKEQTDADSN